MASLPVAFASTESLYVNNFDSTYTDWTSLGTTPYLDTVDTSSVIKIKAAGTHGWFDFPSTSFSSITSVHAYIYCLQWDGDVLIEFEWSGDTTAETSIQTTSSTSTWVDLGTVTDLDTDTEINACRVRFTWAAAKNDWVEIDAFYLYVDGTGAAGQNVTETLYASASVSSSLTTNKGLGYGLSASASVSSSLTTNKGLGYELSASASVSTSMLSNKGLGYALTASASASGTMSFALEKGAFLSETSYVLTSAYASGEHGFLLIEFLGVETSTISSELIYNKALGFSLSTSAAVNSVFSTQKEKLLLYGETVTAQIETITQKEMKITLSEIIYETPQITAVLYWSTDETPADDWFLIAALLLIIVLILLALIFSGVIQ